MYFPPGVGCVSYVASVVLHSCSNVPPWCSMYYPSFTLLRFLCTIKFIPCGASSVLLKSNCNSISVCDKIVGFIRKGLSIFKVILVCGISLHRRCIGKWVPVLDTPTMKLFFHVMMDRSAVFTRWICGGTNWYSISFCLFYFLRLDYASFPSQCTRGLYPLLVGCSTFLL